MNFLIVTGLSGAGKSMAVNALEDIGFFCIDNIPVALLPRIVDFALQGENQLSRVAVVMDVRGLPNPFYVPELKHKTGLDQEVVDYVMASEESQELLRRYEYMLEYALPLYIKEGKSQLMIAVGCTGGKHRSITFARKIGEFCEKLGYAPSVQHRDVNRSL